MATIAAVGLLMAGSLRVAAYARYASAAARYGASEVYYKEGRVLLPECVEVSQELMEARLALCLTTAGRVAVIRGHLARSGALIEQELSLGEGRCFGGYVRVDVLEAQQMLDVSWLRLKRLAGSEVGDRVRWLDDDLPGGICPGLDVSDR